MDDHAVNVRDRAGLFSIVVLNQLNKEIGGTRQTFTNKEGKEDNEVAIPIGEVTFFKLRGKRSLSFSIFFSQRRENMNAF